MYEPYQATIDGKILNKSGKELKTKLHKGYPCVCIHNHTINVHRIVAEQLLPNPEHKAEVHHKDSDPTNNTVENLLWVTRAEHSALHPYARNNTKITWTMVDYIRAHPELRTGDLALKFKVSNPTISLIRHGKTWKECYKSRD